MAFADQLLTETEAEIAIVDRRALPGGHWNDAYPFVRLHQPSAFYGVGSRELGSDRLDASGPNKGNRQLASGSEVMSYFDALMRERFLPSGRVAYFPMCDYLEDGRLVSRLSGAERRVEVRRKLVDTTFFDVQVPATHQRPFHVEPGLSVVAPGDLPRAAPAEGRYVIVGAGKTAMDVAVWLLQSGADRRQIRWIAPRDSWLINRDMVQPGETFFHRTVGGYASQLEACARATSPADLFERLERGGQLLRIDPSVQPTMFRGATISPGEVELLRGVEDVVRKGRVRRLERGAIVLEHGRVEAAPGDLYIDCSAKGFGGHSPVPVFDGRRITPQMVRANVISLSASLIAHVEAAYDSDAEKNALCSPIPPVDCAAEWAGQALADLRNARTWSADKALRRWIAEHRLSGASGAATPVRDAATEEILRRIAAARPGAEANLARLAGEPAAEAAA
jgi:hypothetical protein